MLCDLVGGERTAGDLVRRSGLSQSACSLALSSRLREEGLLATRREAQSIHYRIADPRAARVLAILYEIHRKGRRHEPPHTTAHHFRFRQLGGFCAVVWGVGGSILAVPLLVYVVGVKDAHVAIGTSALAVCAMS